MCFSGEAFAHYIAKLDGALAFRFWEMDNTLQSTILYNKWKYPSSIGVVHMCLVCSAVESFELVLKSFAFLTAETFFVFWIANILKMFSELLLVRTDEEGSSHVVFLLIGSRIFSCLAYLVTFRLSIEANVFEIRMLRPFYTENLLERSKVCSSRRIFVLMFTNKADSHEKLTFSEY